MMATSSFPRLNSNSLEDFLYQKVQLVKLAFLLIHNSDSTQAYYENLACRVCTYTTHTYVHMSEDEERQVVSPTEPFSLGDGRRCGVSDGRAPTLLKYNDSSNRTQKKGSSSPTPQPQIHIPLSSSFS
jgi:hypothetical protein